MIRFGPRSIVLLVAAANGLLLAALLWGARANRIPNRLLAALVLVFVLRILPFIAGYAGYYDAYPWLSFAPYNLSLSFGPLLWLYTRALTTGSLPRRWIAHLAPAAAQCLYYVVVFSWSVSEKNHWNDAVHVPYVLPVESLWTWCALALFLALSVRDYRGLQRRLDAHLSNREEFRLDWLRRVLFAVGATLALWVASSAIDAFVTPLDYFDVFPLYLWWAALVYYLGLGGWRNASVVIPATPVGSSASESTATEEQGASEARSGESVPSDDTPRRTGTDWHALGTRWAKETRAAEYWRDPDLTLASLARALSTNSSYLSRALNEGLGESFNGFVNRLRVDAVKQELARGPGGRDVLAIGLDAGFRSKASFNRVFRESTGTTPTAFRQAAGQTGVSNDENMRPTPDLP